MDELILNLHMHTTYSDGTGLHSDLAEAAIKTGVDVLLVTDHNVWVQGVEGYHHKGKKSVLLLVGEEIHDQDRHPQKNHLLVFGTRRELAPFADNPQTLIDAVRDAGGICFIAHPIDPALPAFNEDDISWEAWDVLGYTGIELWNGFSELKVVVKNKLQGLFYAYFPEAIARGPIAKTLSLWDRLMDKGNRIVAVAGSDAHARQMTLGPLKRVVFPYEFHFTAINNHILVPSKLTGNIDEDRIMVLDALAKGHCFIGYDLIAPTGGFRFSAHGNESKASMGETIPARGGVTLQIKIPAKAEIILIKDGRIIKKAKTEALTHVTTEPGVFRVEVYRRFLGRRRGWIFSNPIYIR